MHSPFSPGANLDAMNKAVLENLQKSADELAAGEA